MEVDAFISSGRYLKEKITAAKGESFRRSATLTDVYFQGS